MPKKAFRIFGLTQEQKDFLHRYAQNHLGSSSRTKAILDLIDTAMRAELEQESPNGAEQNTLKNQAIANKKAYIKQHQEAIKNHHQAMQQAKAQGDRHLIKTLASKKLGIKKQRLQLSLPKYDYDYLQKLAQNSSSSIQYYTTVIILQYLYSQKRLLGNEIEVLKRSNYELYKIGVNINQIAKANNVGNKIELPINHLHQLIKKHISLVQALLYDNTNIY